MITELDWAILRVKPNSEVELSRKLLFAGFDVYCPRVTERLNNRYSKNKYDRYRYAYRALFPGYFFSKINRQFRTVPIPSRIAEEIKILRARDGRMLTISQDEIMEIKLTENENQMKPLEPAVWQKNQVVRILGKAFEGTKGKIIDVSAKSAQVAFDVEGRSLVFSVRLSSIRKA